MAKGGFRPGMGGGMNMNMIKQAQKMQQDMLKMQEELENKEYEASTGGGVVTARVNGKHEVLNLTIAPDAVVILLRIHCPAIASTYPLFNLLSFILKT